MRLRCPKCRFPLGDTSRCPLCDTAAPHRWITVRRVLWAIATVEFIAVLMLRR